MLRINTTDQRRAQVLLEYALVIGAVITIVFAMSTLIKRGSQGMIKTVADQMGNQAASDQAFGDRGHLEQSYSSSRTSTIKDKNEFVGNIRYSYDDVITTDSRAVVNLGFTNQN